MIKTIDKQGFKGVKTYKKKGQKIIIKNPNFMKYIKYIARDLLYLLMNPKYKFIKIKTYKWRPRNVVKILTTRKVVEINK